MKRTYNLSPGIVATVREEVEVYQEAPSQDSFVEEAIRSLARRRADARDAARWEAARRDPEFLAEIAEIAREFAGDDVAVLGE